MLKYTLKQLEIFDAVAELSSVCGASKKLCMTQSAVSMALSQLEKQLSRPLFIRHSNRLVLSHWGQWLRPKARRLLQDAQQIQSGLHDQQIISGILKLSSSQTAAEHLLPTLISQVDTDFPELRIDFSVENTEHVIQGVIDYEYDLGVIESRNDDSRLQHESWIDDHLVVVASPHHPYASKKEVSLAQLEQAKWVLREHGSGSRGIFDGAIHGLIENINVWKEYQHIPLLIALVKQGAYLSALPYLDVEQDINSGELILLPTPQLDMHRSLTFIWRKNSGDNPLRDCILAEGRRLIRQRRRNKQIMASSAD